MKIKYLILTILTLLISSHNLSYAQNRIGKSTVLELSGGYSINGWNISLGAEFITGTPEHSILVQANYLNYKVNRQDFTLPIDNYNLSVNYMFSFCKLIHAPINIGVFAGIFGGYENYPTSINTIVVENQPGITYGLSAGLVIDVYLTKWMSVFVTPKIMYNFNNQAIRPLLFAGNLGFRFTL